MSDLEIILHIISRCVKRIPPNVQMNISSASMAAGAASLKKTSWYCNIPSRVEEGPEGADRGEAHLNDVRFNSNWVFFTNNDCLKIDIQYQKFLKIPKFGLTEGVIFNSENGKLSCSQKWWYRQISEMGGENSKKFFCIASCGLLPTLKKKFGSRAPPGPLGTGAKWAR